MQTDGNLVIYLPSREVIWSSDTYGHPNSSLVVQDDGNVVIYDPNHTALWATDTLQPPVPPIGRGWVGRGDTVGPDETLTSTFSRNASLCL